MKKRFSPSPLLRGGLMLLAAAAIAVLWPRLEPKAAGLLQKAALFTTVLDMPTGALEALRERYAAELLPEAPDGPAPQQEPEPEDPPPAEQQTPEIPEEYRGTVTELTMTGDDSPAYVKWGSAWIRNYTGLTAQQIQKILETPGSVKLGFLLLEYVFSLAVGAVLAEELEECGLAVLHDTTQHDNPAYTGAYLRSTQTIKSYQQQYGSLRVLLDIHRDAILYSDTSIAKTVAVVHGKKAAQLMIIAPYDDGTLNLPNWRENFRFAVALTDAIESAYPGLTRPVFFCSRSYNYACSDGALLLEFGTNGNTMEEAQYTAELIAPILAEVLQTS